MSAFKFSGKSSGGLFGGLKTRAPIALIALFFVSGLFMIETFPPVNYLGDELYFFGSASGYIKDRLAGAESNAFQPRMYIASLNLFLLALGKGIWQARLFSLLMAALGVLVVYRLGREMKDETAGLIAALFVGTSYIYQWNSRLIRPEAMSMAFVTLAFYLIYAASKREKSGRLVLYGGLLAGLSINVHPNNFQYVVSLFAATAVIHFKKMPLRAVALYFAGTAASFIVWLAAVYLPAKAYPLAGGPQAGDLKSIYSFIPLFGKNFFALFMDSLSAFYNDYAVNYFRMADGLFLNEISFRFFAYSYLLIFASALFTQGRKKVAGLVLFVAGTLFMNYFLTPHFGYWHMVEFVPFLSLAAAIGITSVSKAVYRGRASLVAGAAAVIIAGAGLYNIGSSAVELSEFSYKKLLRSVSARVPQGSKVFAHELYSPALKQGYVTYGYDVDHPGTTCEPFAEALDKTGAEYVVFDDVLRGFMRSSCGEAYERAAFAHLLSNSMASETINIGYPNYWASSGMLRNIYIFRVR